MELSPYLGFNLCVAALCIFCAIRAAHDIFKG